MDSTSFASVLAGVKRMRELYEDENSKEEKNDDVIEVQPEALSSKEREPKRFKDNENDSVKHKLEENDSVSTTQTSVQERPTAEAKDKARAAVLRDKVRTNVQMYSQIQVSPSQKGNPMFQSPLLKGKPIAYNKEILSDYYINPTLQVLFLSLKYHQLHPEYIWRRCKKLNQGSVVSNVRDKSLKILLAVIDIDNPQDNLRKLNNICIKQDLTLLVAWTFEQAGNYVAMLKEHELSYNKVNLTIKGVMQTDYKSSLTNCLTNIKSINKTDVINLMTEIGSFKNIVENSNDIKINGFGDRKIQNLRQAFKEPFIYNKD